MVLFCCIMIIIILCIGREVCIKYMDIVYFIFEKIIVWIKKREKLNEYVIGYDNYVYSVKRYVNE